MRNISKYLAIAVAVITGYAAYAVDPGNRIRTHIYLDATGNNAKARVSTSYFDGLGRERLSVENQAGGDGEDIALRTDYDARGNIGRKWLPVIGGENLLNASAFNTAIIQLYGDSEIPYTQYHYEEFGLNRQSGMDGPGELWINHGLRTDWSTNTETGDGACTILTAAPDGTITVSGVYKPHTLQVIETTDADGMKTLVFQNRSGRTVLERRIGTDGLRADTRYIYDIRGDLRCVLSPEGSQLLPVSGKVSANTIDLYGQRFEYDILHRCISSKVPGCGAVEYVYNLMDMVCMESSAEQRARGEWTVTKFDSRRRPALRGTVILPGKTRAELQCHYGDSLMQERLEADINKAEGVLMYTSVSGPAGFTPYMAWFYDNYDFIVGPNSTKRALFETSASDGYTQQGLCTGTARLLNGSGELWLSATKYNHRGQPVLTSTWDLYLQNERHTVTSLYDFVGNETERREVTETMMETTVTGTHTAVTKSTYDTQGRPLSQTLSIDNGPEITLSSMTYDSFGRLQTNDGAVQTEYSYDIRSNLTGISSPLFSQTAWFGQNPTAGATVRYGGINALRTEWTEGQDLSGIYGHTETFSYDGLGRYRSSKTADGRISEQIGVDLDANVISIVRKYNGDVVQDAEIVMNGGMISDVFDASTPYWTSEVGRFPEGSYIHIYDRDGRLTADGTRDITSVTYHPFGNLPRRITMGNGDFTQSDYLPDGTLRRRTFSSRKVETVVTVNADGDTITSTRTRTLTAVHSYSGKFEKTPDGLIYHTGSGHYDLSEQKHYWYLRDRMGSTVAVVDGDGQLLQTTGYYPSGTPYRLPSTAIQTPVDEKTDRLHIGNKWLGHSGLAMYDNTARLHDPLLMRFCSPDPLYAKYGSLSPWTHCAADPLNHFDPDGRKLVADSWSQQGIRDGFPIAVREYINFDVRGQLITDDLNKTDYNSPNFESLKLIANADEMTIVNGVSSYIFDGTEYELGNDTDESYKGYSFFPGVKGSESPDENINVITSTNLSPVKRASNLAHELYGHVVAFLKGLDPVHRSNGENTVEVDENGEFIIIFTKGNQQLEQTIKDAEDEARKNFYL